MQHLEIFEQYRPLLFSIAYRMMGTAMEAEDVIQDAYLRYSKADTHEVESHKYYLTTIVTRLCMDRLQSAKAQREVYTGNWLPEPIATADQPVLLNPSERVSKMDSISMAFLVLLEQLSAAERAVFLLREVFDYDYDEIARMIDKSEEACRQLFSRAKKHIHANRPRYDSNPEQHQAILMQFLDAINGGELDGLVTMLTEDAVLISDGGTKRGRATRPVYGATNVARFLLGIHRQTDQIPEFTLDIRQINGAPAAVLVQNDGTPWVVLSLELLDGKVRQVHILGDDDKLKNV